MPQYTVNSPIKYRGQLTKAGVITLPADIGDAHVTSGHLAPLDVDVEPLLGSNIMPATVPTIDGGELSLGEIVAEAQAASGLPVAHWNELPDAQREDLIFTTALDMGCMIPADVLEAAGIDVAMAYPASNVDLTDNSDPGDEQPGAPNADDDAKVPDGAAAPAPSGGADAANLTTVESEAVPGPQASAPAAPASPAQPAKKTTAKKAKAK